MNINLRSIALGADFIAKQMGVEPTDLSQVSDPVGRVDYLVSQIAAHVVKQLKPEAQMTYHASKRLLDGILVKHLGQVRVKVPEDVMELVRKLNADEADAGNIGRAA